MARAVVAGIVGLSVALAGCSGGSTALKPFGPAPACPLLAQLAVTGQTVATANVSDPDAFDATMRAAVASYVRTAKVLRTTVPVNLRGDVDRMIAAARAHRFADAETARDAIDEYEKAACKTT